MSSDRPAAAQRERLLWLDGFRGAATLLMIETHVVNTFLARELRDPFWFGWLNYLNGLVAPSFLFIAGFALGLAMRRGSGKPVNFKHKAIRLSEIFVIGVLLHFPYSELVQKRWDDAWRVGTQMDVLPCIAVALTVAAGIEWFAQHAPGKWREWFWAGSLLIFSGLAVIGAPWLQTWTSGPVPVIACVNHLTGSLFPLLPWAAFVFAGALLGSMRRMGWWYLLAWLAVGVIAAFWRGRTEFSSLSAAFFLERLAWVVLLAQLCRVSPIWEKRDWLRLAGRESLLLYVVHLIIISAVVSAGVSEAGPGFAGVGLMFVAVAAVSFGLAICKARWTERRERLAAETAATAIPHR